MNSLNYVNDVFLAELLNVDQKGFSFWTLIDDFGFDHVHPMLVHFPVALGVFGVFVYILTYIFKQQSPCWKSMSFLIILFAFISALVAATSGGLFAYNLHETPGKIEGWHSTMATITTILFGLGCLIQIWGYYKWRDLWKYKHWCLLIYILAAICVLITAFLGSGMVFNFLVNPTMVGGPSA